MVVTREVSAYEALLMSGLAAGGGSQVGVAYFYDPSAEYVGCARIIRDGAPLPRELQWSSDALSISLHEAELMPLLGRLRDEHSVFVSFNTGRDLGSAETNLEPVGEQEKPTVR